VPSGTPLVHAREVEREGTEVAGTFRFEREVVRDCGPGDVDTFEPTDEGVRLSGGFEACDAEWSLLLTESPGGVAFAVTVDEPALNEVELQWGLDPDAGLHGFGAQYSRFDLRGSRLPIWSQEQGVGRGAEPVTGILRMLGQGNEGDWHTTYTAVPAYITDGGQGFLLSNTERVIFDFTESGRGAAEIWSGEARGVLLAGGSMVEVLESLSEIVGVMEPLPEWTQTGAILRAYGGADAVRQRVFGLLDAGVPVAGVWIEDWAGSRETFLGTRMLWNWVPNRALYPDWPGLIEELGARGVRVLCYFNPFLVDATGLEGVERVLWDEAVEGGYLVRDAEGEVLEIEQGGFQSAIIDLTDEGARAWMGQLLRDQIDAGVSGWMADFGEALPLESSLSDGSDPWSYHNRYPVEWARLNRETVRAADAEDEILFFSRSGGTMSPRWSRSFWLGDQTTSWDEFDGFKTVIPGFLSSGLSGYTIQHSDTGGYLSLDLGPILLERDAELFQRWTELNAFTVLLRVHSTNRPESNYQPDTDEAAAAHFGRFGRIFAAMAAYRGALMEEAGSGLPLVRPMNLHYPEESAARDRTAQFMLGADFVVAPVLDPGETSVSTWLPPGRWVHLWSGDVYEDAGEVTIDAPIGQPGVFYREAGTWGVEIRAALEAEQLL
jgi:alpha-glucosidase